MPSDQPAKRKRASRTLTVFHLSLYIAGTSARCLRTIESVKRAFEEHAPGRYHLTVVDIYRTPAAAAEAQVIAVPTLVQTRPRPGRIFVGTLPSSDRVQEVFRMAVR